MEQRFFNVAWSDWSESFLRVVAPEEIPSLIEALDAEVSPPAMVLIWEVGSERELGVGLGRERTVLTYQESTDPPYFISQGDSEEKGVEWFCFGTQENEYLASNLVAKSKIVPTLNSFLNGEKRLRGIKWEML